MYKIIEYPHGTRLVCKRVDAVSSVSLGIWVNAGSRNEIERMNGVSHFLEHLVFKGSRLYSGDQIKQAIEGVGGSLNAFTSEENTCYYAKFLGKHLKDVLEILSDMTFRPSLRASDIEKERGVIMEEIRMYKDLPQYQVAEIFDEILWPNHPLGRNIAGSFDSVAGLGRKDILRYHSGCYGAGNIVISCAGHFDEAVLFKGVEKVVRAHEASVINRFEEAGPMSVIPRVKVVCKAIEQTHLMLGFPAVKRSDPDRFALGVLHIILGGNMSSRLFNEIREKKGLAYEIASHVKKLKDTGIFFVHAGVDNKKSLEAWRVICDELERIRSQKVGADELRRAKDFYKAQSEMALDDTMEHMLWMGDSVTNLGFVQTKQEVCRQIEKIEREDILRLAKKVIRWESLHAAAVGPGVDIFERHIGSDAERRLEKV